MGRETCLLSASPKMTCGDYSSAQFQSAELLVALAALASTMDVRQSTVPRQVLLLSHARTGCHLLQRMLSAQPNTSYGGHYFAPARPLLLEVLDSGPPAGASAELQKQLAQAFKSGNVELETFLKDARRTKSQTFFYCHPHFMLSLDLASE